MLIVYVYIITLKQNKKMENSIGQLVSKEGFSSLSEKEKIQECIRVAKFHLKDAEENLKYLRESGWFLIARMKGKDSKQFQTIEHYQTSKQAWTIALKHFKNKL